MNTSIRNLFVVLVLLFGVLLAFTSRWTVFEEGDLRADANNRRDLIRAQRVPRGRILAADGTVLARSVRETSQSSGTLRYERTYPQGGAFVAVVGYSDLSRSETGLERSQNEPLAGKAVKLTTAVNRLVSGDQRGDNVRTTLVPRVQRAAINGLAGRPGSVVALDPRNGKVLAMVSLPTFDPNRAMRDDAYFKSLTKRTDSVLLNRATQDAYVPGSTFKVVTAAAALDTGKLTAESTVDGQNGQVFSATPMNNFGGATYGNVTLRYALTHSVNTAFANVAEDVGKSTMQRYMERFGFGAKPPLDYPANQLRASGSYRNGSLIPATSRFVDVARLGIGQDKLQVTPLQMAMVAAAIANGGRLMEPHLVDRIVDADGRVQRQVEPKLYRRAMGADAADTLRSMMGDVVNDGTGTGAALSGITAGGKTGTAERNIARGLNDLWFIGFAPLENPKVAVAVVVENTTGSGGVVAAPIARDVMQAALGGAR